MVGKASQNDIYDEMETGDVQFFKQFNIIFSDHTIGPEYDACETVNDKL